LSVSVISASARMSSGNACPISRTTIGTSFHISGSFAPSSSAWRMARRMMRRSK